MPIEIRMPALSPTMEKGRLARWLKQEGERVRAGDVIAEIETDKATMEYEATDDGTLAKILVPAGDADVPVNQVIALLAEEGEDIHTAATAERRAASRPSAAASVPPVAPPTSTSPAQTVEGKAAGRLFASPLARRLAREAGIEIARIAGSGPHGRVIARDVLAARAITPAAMAPPVASAPAQALPDDKIMALFAPGSYETAPHDTMRRTIAERLVLAKQTIPHYYLGADCAIGRLLAARAEINAAAPKDADGNPAYKLSVNDFVIKALALALQKVPDANVTWTQTAMLRHKHSDIGVAVAIPGGLITPVVRKAESKSLSAISNEMKDLVARARTRKLKSEEYTGGSSTVSNLGMYAVKEFAAVINPPHATILAVGMGEERAVARNGKIEAAMMMTVTLSADHRAVDGAVGAELLSAFKALIENPVLMVV